MPLVYKENLSSVDYPQVPRLQKLFRLVCFSVSEIPDLASSVARDQGGASCKDSNGPISESDALKKL